MFTDIKDFTLKTSLLTNKQVEKILIDHKNLVIPVAERNHGKVIKSLGDAFMIVFSSARDALDCSLALQREAAVYNQDKKLNLFKIELRIALDKGEVLQTKTSDGDDYYGEAVNMSSRLESITPENSIFLTGKVYEEVKEIPAFTIIPLGKTTFRGILYEVEIYKALYDEREIRDFKSGKIWLNELSWNYVDKYRSIINETDGIIFNCACVSALLWVQPIPFLDNFSAIPLYIYMLTKISSMYGEELTTNTAFEFTKKVIAAIWITYLSLYASIGMSKIILPWLWGYAVIPINFAITYALGKVFSMHYYSKNFWVQLSNREMKALFTDKRMAGKSLAQKQKDAILEKGREFKIEIEKHLKEITENLKKVITR